MENGKLFSVFFHEMGHFVARQIGLYKNFGPEPTEITICKCYDNNLEFCGKIKYGIDNTFNRESIPKHHLPYFFAENAYGCFFQAFYTRGILDDCIKFNGASDVSKTKNALRLYTLDYLFNDIPSIEHIYYNYLCTNDLLKGFVSLEPSIYLYPTNNNCYFVNLEKLKFDIDCLIKEHIVVYDMLLTDYDQLLNSN